MTTGLRFFAEWIALVAMILAVLVLIFLRGPEVEAHFFPVVKNFTLSHRVNEETYWKISGSFLKARDCEFRGLTWTHEDKISQRVAWESYDQPTNTDTSRPAGYSAFGPWHIFKPLVDEGQISSSKYSVTVRHFCHRWWPTVTKVGTFNLATGERYD